MVKWIIVMMVLNVASVTVSANELQDRARINQQTKSLFFSKNFKELEGMAQNYRSNKIRTTSGLWKLTLFYFGLSAAINNRNQDEKFRQMATSNADEWVAEYPDSATAHIAKGLVLERIAWNIRGGGYANTVAQDRWKPFLAQLKKARLYLKKYKSISREDPHWYTLMLAIATAEDWDKEAFAALFDEAVKSEPLYYQTYFNTTTYLLPKWHGNAQFVEEFANTVVNYTRSEEGTGMYARIYWVASSSQFGKSLFTRSSVVWEKMRGGIQDVIARYPDQWNINNFAYFSCLARDRDFTRKLINKIKGKPIMQAWKNMRDYEYCLSWANEGTA